jgi:hypothetical protein
MKKRTERRKLTDELRGEYDLSKLKGVRGKYATRYQAGTNLVLLSPDVAEYFPDERPVRTPSVMVLLTTTRRSHSRSRERFRTPGQAQGALDALSRRSCQNAL